MAAAWARLSEMASAPAGVATAPTVASTARRSAAPAAAARGICGTLMTAASRSNDPPIRRHPGRPSNGTQWAASSAGFETGVGMAIGVLLVVVMGAMVLVHLLQ